MEWVLYVGAPVAGLVGMMSGGFWGVGCGWFVVPALLAAGADTMTAIGVALLQMMLATVPTVCRQAPRIGWGPGSYGRSLALPICLAAAAMSFFGKQINELLIGSFGSERPIQLIFIFFVGIICVQTALSRTACYHDTQVAISAKNSCRGAVYGAVAGLISSMCGIGGGMFIRPLLTSVFRVPEYHTSRIVRLSVMLTTGIGGITYLAGPDGWNSQVLLLSALAAAGGLIGFPIGTRLHAVVYEAGYAQHIHKSFSLIALFSILGTGCKLFGWLAAGRLIIIAGAVGLVVYLAGFTLYARRHPVDKIRVE